MNTQTKCPHCGAEEIDEGVSTHRFKCGTVVFDEVPFYGGGSERVRTCYERQIAALQSELAKRQWQPIETAPKGKKAFCFSPAKHGRNSLSEWIRVQYPEETPFRMPTHWQPLPEPPKE